VPYRRIIRGKSKPKLSANYPAERRAIPNNPWKVKTFANYPAESFGISRKVKISLFKGLSLLLKLILDTNSTMGDQYYSRFGRKNGKTWDT
jgi:hypothetical protein